MVDALLAVPSLTDPQRAAIEAAKREYEATWDDAVVDSTQGATSGGQATTKEWKFHAAQLTFNCTQGEWASKAPAVLKALFHKPVVSSTLFGPQALWRFATLVHPQQCSRASGPRHFATRCDLQIRLGS